MESIFFEFANLHVNDLNERCKNTMNTALGIVYTEIGHNYLKATMPVSESTIQPFKMLNGGASLALIEMTGSMAANLVLNRNQFAALGQSVYCNHVKSAMIGETVTATASAIHIGKTSQVWKVEISNELDLLICSGTITMANVPLSKLL